MGNVGYYEAYAKLFIAKVSCEHTFVMEGTMDDSDKRVHANKIGREALGKERLSWKQTKSSMMRCPQ